ncbi:DUF6350 family protein [Cumulibacter soli]|uniref:cell division protein PerM n=1 Tax=Cumulibacter soli TaxID=2546344 RepID=UPI001067B278|nr:DUF6350 family protein [Cumulibacter soli]
MSAPTSSDARPESRGRPNVVLWASVSAIGVVLAGTLLLIALSLLSWATDRPEGAGAGSAAQVAMQAWYLAHSVALPVSWGTLSVPPLLIGGFIALLFYRAGRSTARACELRTTGHIAEALAAVVITYVTCAVLLSSIAYPSDPKLSISPIVIGTGLVSLVPTLAGLLRESGLGARLVSLLPGPSYAYTRGALATLWSLAAMAALVVGCSLLINFSEVSALNAALAPGGLGGLTMIGISIAYLPNAMLLATALGSGAGFSLGGDSLYSLGTLDREPLPIFPLFGALPHAAGGLVLFSVLIPLLAAVVGALTMTRHLEPEHRSASNLLMGSLVAGALTAIGVLGVGLFASGSLGDGRLTDVGAPVVATAIRVGVIVILALALTSFIATRRSLKPVSVWRRERALSVLETGGPDGEKTAKGSAAKVTAAKGANKNGAGKGATGDDIADGDTSDDADPVAVAAAEGLDPNVAVAHSVAIEDDAKRATRPVIKTRLAMRRLARSGERAAKAKAGQLRAADASPSSSGEDGGSTAKTAGQGGSRAGGGPGLPEGAGSGAQHTAPAASLSVVKRARSAEESPVPASSAAKPADTKPVPSVAKATKSVSSAAKSTKAARSAKAAKAAKSVSPATKAAKAAKSVSPATKAAQSAKSVSSAAKSTREPAPAAANPAAAKPTAPEDKPTSVEDKPKSPEDKLTSVEDSQASAEDEPTSAEDEPTSAEPKPGSTTLEKETGAQAAANTANRSGTTPASAKPASNPISETDAVDPDARP